jgi:hypothetical protein
VRLTPFDPIGSNAAQLAFPQATWPAVTIPTGVLTFVMIVGLALGDDVAAVR